MSLDDVPSNASFSNAANLRARFVRHAQVISQQSQTAKCAKIKNHQSENRLSPVFFINKSYNFSTVLLCSVQNRTEILRCFALFCAEQNRNFALFCSVLCKTEQKFCAVLLCSVQNRTEILRCFARNAGILFCFALFCAIGNDFALFCFAQNCAKQSKTEHFARLRRAIYIPSDTLK